MKIAAITLNVVLFLFVCLVILTDGPPREPAYIACTLLSLLIPVLSAIVIWRFGSNSAHRTAPFVALACNVIWLGFTCWALVDQYPHPKEEGLVAFVFLMVLTPIISLAALLRTVAPRYFGIFTKKKV